ncbi:MAG: hypothetical protein WCS43_18115, partial [Verrucomicrobiota bacterium]
RLALWSDHGSAPEFAGGINYAFAANPGATPYDSWKLDRFTAPELLDPLVGGDHADPDHDGIPNILEFALGGEPKSHAPDDLPHGEVKTIGSDRHLTFSYTRRPPADGVTYLPESSADLINWNDNPAQFTTVSITPLGSGLGKVEIRLTTPLPGGPNFIRLKAVLAP